MGDKTQVMSEAEKAAFREEKKLLDDFQKNLEKRAEAGRKPRPLRAFELLNGAKLQVVLDGRRYNPRDLDQTVQVPTPVIAEPEKAGNRALKLLQEMVSEVMLPSTNRWPCPVCGRQGPEYLKTLLSIGTEGGESKYMPCWYCSIMEKYLIRAEELLDAVGYR